MERAQPTPEAIEGIEFCLWQFRGHLRSLRIHPMFLLMLFQALLPYWRPKIKHSQQLPVLVPCVLEMAQKSLEEVGGGASPGRLVELFGSWFIFNAAIQLIMSSADIDAICNFHCQH